LKTSIIVGGKIDISTIRMIYIQ